MTIESQDERHFFYLLARFEQINNEWPVDLDTNGKLMNFKTDSEDQGNILPFDYHNHFIKSAKILSIKY